MAPGPSGLATCLASETDLAPGGAPWRRRSIPVLRSRISAKPSWTAPHAASGSSCRATTWDPSTAVNLSGRASDAQLARDHHLLDLVGALADGEDLGVAIEAADGVLLDVAVAAVDLHSLLRRPHGEAAGDQLRLGGREGEGLAAVLEDRRPVDEQARGLALRRDVG